MLELLFQSLEQAFGSSLTRLATVVYWAGLLALLLSCFIPLYRLWRDYYAERIGLVRRWVITCKHCQKPTYVTGTHCTYCEADLRIPWTLRGMVPFWSERHGKLGRHLRRASRLFGIVAFLVGTAIVLTATRAFGVQGSLPQLFVGLSLLAWAAFGRSATRLLRLEGEGLSGRVTEALIAGIALLVFVGTVFLADAARSQEESRLMRLTSSGSAVQIGEQAMAIPNGDLRFEYLQLDHKALGYHRIIPLAFHGEGRVSLLEDGMEQWLAERLMSLADGRSRRGLLIRLRTEHLRVAPGDSYDLIHRDGQVILKRLGTT